ncbi:restriction endonuclease subunit S [Dubosiella newyorkensis]|uniref:Type I restriction modification DNA specificity domain-containing protein n=1 Tax=Dubosiella newyorkensis TaxID=1862672 RepID=A0A1U7NM34_9FIRM|nr:restriction endonuclease subunit S [Dubosiella newyorkensis]OLU46189.1 hypothetical protein BO225_06835 [Dubosiella newyorkensis]
MKDFIVESGIPQFRIRVSESDESPVYYYYTQDMLQRDLELDDTEENLKEARQIRTNDSVMVVHTGDLIVNSITGDAAIVQPVHNGFMLTKNFYRIVPNSNLDSAYLLYLLNEDHMIEKEMRRKSNGINSHLISVRELENLRLPKLPSLEEQKIIGDLYLNLKKLTRLKKKNSERKEKVVLAQLKKLYD